MLHEHIKSAWSLTHQTGSHMTTEISRPTVKRLQSPSYPTDRHTTTSTTINRSDWQAYVHKVRQIRLTDVRPQSPTDQTDRRTSTKSNRSDRQTHVHKVRQIRLTGVRPTHHTDRRTSDRSDWQAYVHKVLKHQTSTLYTLSTHQLIGSLCLYRLVWDSGPQVQLKFNWTTSISCSFPVYTYSHTVRSLHWSGVSKTTSGSHGRVLRSPTLCARCRLLRELLILLSLLWNFLGFSLHNRVRVLGTCTCAIDLVPKYLFTHAQESLCLYRSFGSSSVWINLSICGHLHWTTMDTGAFYEGTSSSMLSLPGSSPVPPHVATPYDPYMPCSRSVHVGVTQTLDKISATADLKEEVAQLLLASLKNQQLETALSVSGTSSKPEVAYWPFGGKSRFLFVVMSADTPFLRSGNSQPSPWKRWCFIQI